MIHVAPDRPWTPERARQCVRGSVVLKLVGDAAPEHLPHYLDVRARRADASTTLDGGGIDRALRRHAPGARVMRAFRAAHEHHGFGGPRPRWDDVERGCGLSRTFRVEVDPQVGLLPMCADLAGLADVESVSPHYLCATPFAASAAGGHELEYAHALVRAPEALAFEPGDSTLVVGVIDSGLDLEHPELYGRARPGTDTVDLSVDRLSRGLSLVGDVDTPDRIPRDEMGHGTACASIIAARGREVSRGVAGVAWVLPVRALAGARMLERGALTAIGAVLDIDEACKRAIDLGAKVLNLSFGTPAGALREDDPVPHADVVEYARRRGCVLVAASGNDGQSTPYYPAALEGVIAVGSVGPTRAPSRFSTRGDHVALCGPGEQVHAASLGGYDRHSGTSFAAPFVSGAAALLIARAARYGVALAPDDVRRVLVRNCQPFADDVDTTGCGPGVLDIAAALVALERELSRPARSPEFATALHP